MVPDPFETILCFKSLVILKAHITRLQNLCVSLWHYDEALPALG